MRLIKPTPAVSAATSFTSAPIALGDIINYSIQAVFSGADVAGTFKLQVSNDKDSGFLDLTGSSTAITNSGDELLNISNASYAYVRYDWAYTSGTGNITVYFCGKEQLPRKSLR